MLCSKSDVENVICSDDPNALFASFSIWGENAGPDYIFDHKSRMFFPRKYYKNNVETLWSSRCKCCNTWNRDLKALKQHVAAAHDRIMCALCIEHKKVFSSEQIIYSKADYETHLRRGGREGFEGHPQCEFCRKRYYDKDMLFGHLHKDHFSCHICERAGIRYRYYKDYSSLEEHFRAEHILCEEPSCLAQKFIVFADCIDHAAHMLQVHPNIPVSRRIPLHFRSARDGEESSIDGGGRRKGGAGGRRRVRGGRCLGKPGAVVHLEGGMGGRAIGGEWQVELPDAARDPREVLRESLQAQGGAVPPPVQHEFNAEHYPALHTSATPDRRGYSAPLWSGNSRHGVGRSRYHGGEDFPVLGGCCQAVRPAAQGWGSVSGATIRVGKTSSVIRPRAGGAHAGGANMMAAFPSKPQTLVDSPRIAQSTLMYVFVM